MNRACAAVGLSRSTAYRQLAPKPEPAQPAVRPSPARRIPDADREYILSVLDSNRFIDQPVREVYATLLSEGTYFAHGAPCIGCSRNAGQ
jgi:putative transposase